MNIYSIARPFLFQLDAETAHDLSLKSLRLANQCGLLSLFSPKLHQAPVKVMGIDFPNLVGLGAGLDKNGAYIDGLAALGFGFIEIGTTTPRPQPGNPKPRLFRVKQAQGVINRFGFNNLGVDALLANVKQASYQGVLGINIGKNFDTPNERAVDDYLICMRKVYAHASYITVNISSPNTKNLRQLQEKDALDALLATLKHEQGVLAQQHGKYVPIALKIAPDLDLTQVEEIAGLLKQHQIDGVIATNTTLSREGVEGLPNATEKGGLSGAPVFEKSTQVLAMLSKALAGEVPIIGVGGILSVDDARAKLEAGASLVQVYSGLVYRGPALVQALLNGLSAR
jgi:dihydroorotate dehydrogenase